MSNHAWIAADICAASNGVASSARESSLDFRASGSEPIQIAEQASASAGELGGDGRIADPRGSPLGDFDDSNGAGWVGKPLEIADAASEPAPRPLLTLDAFEEGGRRLKSLGRGHPGIRALGAVARLDQPLPGARIAGLLQVVGDRVRIGLRASP